MTMKRMFGMLTTSKWMKVISITIVASMLLTLTACGGTTASQQDAGMVTEENSTIERVTEIPNEPGYDIAPGADIPETSTEEPSSTEESPSDNGTVENPPTGGTYTYTIYDGTTVSMDVNVDDYIMSNNNGSFFELYKLMYDYGWLAVGTYSSMDENERLSYAAGWYSRTEGDMMTVIEVHEYANHTVLVNGEDTSQIYQLNVGYSKPNGEMYYSQENDNDVLHSPASVTFDERQGSCDYRILGNGDAITYDDMVLIAYTVWECSNNPGSNPLIPLLGTGYECSTGTTDTATTYLIP